MTWYLLYAFVAGWPHQLAQIEGPFTSRAECVKHEYFSASWCLAGCVQAQHVADAIAELNYSKPTADRAHTYCADKQMGE